MHQPEPLAWRSATSLITSTVQLASMGERVVHKGACGAGERGALSSLV
jgi:hypothetical protein